MALISNLVVPFADVHCRDPALVGGKGANLAILSQASLPVPAGFCVTTQAYAQFSAGIGLETRVAALVADLGEDAKQVESRTAALRQFMVSSPLPAPIADAVLRAYESMGPGAYVAVRSSGTAEDLSGASFAGLHDSYLDIQGPEALLAAIKRCWASMWTARATSYRRSKGFDQSQIKIAVVVQLMVEAELSGVMFTANPLTTATDEIVINATYGLGEALVSGIATPDEYVLALATSRVKEQRVGAKQVRVVRNRDTGSGVITERVAPGDQERFALRDQQISELASLGVRVMRLYGGVPQDIEWAIASGKVFVLQARPITGIEFSWDEELEYWQTMPDEDDTLWTRSWADDIWNGAISPLTYSCWGARFTESYYHYAKIWGIKQGIQVRAFKYHKAEVYFNTGVERLLLERTAPRIFRKGLLANTDPDARDEILRTPLSVFAYLRLHARLLLLGKPVNGPYQYFKVTNEYLHHGIDAATGRSDAVLRALSDQELCLECEHWVGLENKFNRDLWNGWFIYARDAIGVLSLLLAKWYDGDNPLIFTELHTGLPQRSATSEENLALWRLSERIRSSARLTQAFESAGLEYARAFEAIPEGRQFLEEYRRFVAANAHRGHADRDLYFKRRGEDPSIDYQSLRMMLSANSPIDPEEREKQVNSRREAAVAEVEARFRRKRFGALRVWILRRLLNYTYRFFVQRDDQRHFFDRYTFSMKRCVVEIGRRLVERGRLQEQDEVFFLGRRELYALLESDTPDPLLRSKIAGRRHNFERMLKKQANLPAYVRRNKPVSFTAGASPVAGGLLQGVPTSRGTVTARARIVKELRDIGQVVEGDILVTQSTDPGWTPVFNLIKGIVLETGGMLAHGSCLAREYGLPAVQLAGATLSIPDGAVITIRGDTGEVIINESESGSGA